MSRADSWLLVPQKKLGLYGLIVLLVVSSVMTPISLDMYMPAIPHMTEYFSTSAELVNLTLVGYQFLYAIGLLIFGPLSDKYGRRKILIAGIIIYTAGSAACALAISIEFLIATRIIQALGAGAVTAVATAVVKDAIVPEKRELMIGIIQVMMMLGPILAPLIGALILQFFDWRMTFWVLTGIGAFCTVLSFLFKETLPETSRYAGSVFGSVKQLGTVARNKGFISFLLIMALFSLPFMAYISASSYIYQSFFGLTELEYSYFFAIVAVSSAIGPFVWIKASQYLSGRRFITLVMALSLIIGIAMLLFGQLSPIAFCIPMFLYSMASSCTRPYSTNILLTQQDEDTGSASSLINFTFVAVGCLGMVLAVLPWSNYVVGVSSLIVITMAIAGMSWFFFLRSSTPLTGLKDRDPKEPANPKNKVEPILVERKTD